ncbi:hypothetical protein MPC4_290044 [Methylocella tundrae]|uniref:Uncharacterized protein n=1 Tax=Methylocella tundrae TaxID=227605 RepID=A0A8B6M7L3_METTU|nr:hypothetical protein MPC1_1420005 [Methylocella tundrae]VTZ50797.1 hypothetical protein MPC4_290044 [Methylocella tundrae]
MPKSRRFFGPASCFNLLESITFHDSGLIQSEIVGASDALRLDAFFIQRRPKAVNDNFEIYDKIGFLGAGALL